MPSAPAGIVDALNASVSLHWLAIEHYATVAEHLERIGFSKLAERFRADAEEERGHLRACVERLEFYNTQPTYTHAAPQWPRYDVPGILMASLSLESQACETERANCTAARAAGDELTAMVFAKLIEGSEDSIRRLEADRFVIGQVGLDNWLANQT